MNKSGRWASPAFFGPRIPDFLSRLVALSNVVRLSLGESRMRSRGECRILGNPGNASANGALVPGHWEGDLIIGQGNLSQAVTLAENTSLFVALAKLNNGKAEGF
jgi:IS30 family transposase